MRYRLLALGLVLLIGLSRTWLAETWDEATTAALSEEARLAIDVRCADENPRAARECRRVLKRLYLAGALDPDRTLRTYCESVKTATWQARRAAPPALCVQRYGGW